MRQVLDDEGRVLYTESLNGRLKFFFDSTFLDVEMHDDELVLITHNDTLRLPVEVGNYDFVLKLSNALRVAADQMFLKLQG